MPCIELVFRAIVGRFVEFCPSVRKFVIMKNSSSKIIAGKPAPYPGTSTAEQDSKNIFHDLVGAKYIKGELNTLDKQPNSDGILEIVDNEGYPVGRIDVQLKTLPEKNYLNPKFQCERSFFVYCENSILPVILVVVNRRDRKVYWRHIDRETLLEVSANMEGKSYSLIIPVENCIDGTQENHVTAWTQIVNKARERAWNYDNEIERRKALEIELKDLDSKFQNPINLPLPVVKEIHHFLDIYNYILDREFAVVKQVLYPDYWKIGIGILKYVQGDISYILYPVEFKKTQTLIKEVKNGDYEDISKEMSHGNVLLWAGLTSNNQISRQPTQYAYKLLEDSILRITGKQNFPIPDDFVAHEYLISFIDRYHVYLDMEKGLEFYSLMDLKYKLFSVLPMLTATSTGFADWVTEYRDNIDSYHDKRSSSNHTKAIQRSIQRLKENFIPKIKVTLYSDLYNMDLVSYYINRLERKGIRDANRKYRSDMRNESTYGVDLWKTWYKVPLWENLQLFFQNFYQFYNLFINTNFPLIKNSLQIVESEELTIVHILRFDETHSAKPYMEVFHLRPNRYKKGEIFCFLEEDPENPIDRKKYFIDKRYDCQVNGIDYEIIMMHVQVLEFMFTISPTYALINEKFNDKLKRFLYRQQKANYTIL